MTFNDMREMVMNTGEVSFLGNHKHEFLDFANQVLVGKVKPNNPDLKLFIELCLDYYTYSPEGDVLIPDSMYDAVMNVYRSGGNATIVFADSINGKKWNFIKHKVPGLVGTLGKCYTLKELRAYFDKHSVIKRYILAPKFDGISCAIEIKNGEIISASTRYNGYEGQDITQLVKRANNAHKFYKKFHDTGFYKCELCVSTESFNELVKIQKYANRRSATSAICNTPTNIHLAQFITIIPLLYYDAPHNEVEYIAPYQFEVSYYTAADLMDTMEEFLEKIRTREFPFRVDGVVIYPHPSEYWRPNEDDLMDNAIAYKVNTAENKTTIEFGYMSVGRLGKAIPMLRVKPVEVNETIVEDVSLGSWEKFCSMGLMEGEEVIVFSAGDVIPQVKLPSMRLNIEYREPLKIKRRCPYCGEKLERFGGEYYCTNQDCVRIITGRIANFIIKLGVEGFSDKTVEAIYQDLGVKTIHEFLNLTIDDIRKVDGMEITSATNLYNEIQRIRHTPISIATLFGALGIEKISEKKARMLFEGVSLKDIQNVKKLEKLYIKLTSTSGIGHKTAETFIRFLQSHGDEINDILHDMTIGKDVKYKGTIVFTGLRPSPEIKEMMKQYGYEEGSSVTNNTLCVVAASIENESTKMKAANKKGIPVIYLSKLEEFLQQTQYEEELNAG